jgi:signal transduction histidine kinase
VLDIDDAIATTGQDIPRRREGDRVRIRALDADRALPRLSPLSLRQVAVVAMVAFIATALTIGAGDASRHVRFVFFDCAVVIAAIYAGLPGGLFTILVGILVVGYKWLPPHGSMQMGEPASVFAVFGFAFGGLIVTALAARFRRQTRQLADARDAAVAAEERRWLISEAGRVLASSLDYETTVTHVAQLAVPTFADGCAVDLLIDGKIERLAVAHRDPEKLRLLEESDFRIRPALLEGQGIAAVIRTGEPQYAPVVTSKMIEILAQDAEHLGQLRALDIHSAMIVPLVTRGMVLGALTLVSSSPNRRFTEADFNTAQALGRRAAAAIDNARLYRAARAANDVKTNFISTMSHELRTPLSAIIGFQELLADGVSGPVSEGQKQPLERIKASAMQLTSLIEEILLFARLDAGTETVHLEMFPVKRVMDDVVAYAAGPAAERKLTVRAEDVPVETIIESDYAKVRQLLVSLVSNAIKFTSKGEIVLRAHSDDSVITFEVQDSGVGIDHENLAHIFDPFWQVDQSKTRRSGGSGLGLSVARRLAQLLGGEITVDSTPSVGSIFRVQLPKAGPRLA